MPRLLQLARSTTAPLELAWAAERVVAAVADRGDAARCLELLLPNVFDATPPKTADAAFLEALDAAASRAPLCRLAGLCCARAPPNPCGTRSLHYYRRSGRGPALGADVRKAAVDGQSVRRRRPCPSSSGLMPMPTRGAGAVPVRDAALRRALKKRPGGRCPSDAATR